MEQKMIETFVDKFMQGVTIELTRTIRKLIVFLFIISAGLLLTLKSYIITSVLFLLLVGEHVYLSIILKKNNMTIYRAVPVSLILCSHVALLFNIFLFGLQKINDSFDPKLLIVILFIELLCVISGFFYTRRCVKKGTVHKSKTVAAASIAYVFPGVLGYFLARYVINKASIQVQNVFFTIIFAFGCAMMMFVFGMVHMSMLYFIKKYHIADKELPVNA